MVSIQASITSTRDISPAPTARNIIDRAAVAEPRSKIVDVQLKDTGCIPEMATHAEASITSTRDISPAPTARNIIDSAAVAEPRSKIVDVQLKDQGCVPEMATDAEVKGGYPDVHYVPTKTVEVHICRELVDGVSTVYLLLPHRVVHSLLVPRGEFSEMAHRCDVQIDVGALVPPSECQVVLKGTVVKNTLAIFHLQWILSQCCG